MGIIHGSLLVKLNFYWSYNIPHCRNINRSYTSTFQSEMNQISFPCLLRGLGKLIGPIVLGLVSDGVACLSGPTKPNRPLSPHSPTVVVTGDHSKPRWRPHLLSECVGLRVIGALSSRILP
jgi:hypothetical protein